ncbi:MAG: hypothetical protein PHW10_02090 [Candidatus Peribacteraceae bacterium]|nr:hypothetical protein [Candidatus Peribacteraceae bacterium]
MGFADHKGTCILTDENGDPVIEFLVWPKFPVDTPSHEKSNVEAQTEAHRDMYERLLGEMDEETN